ncbi:acid-sensing ion channel 4 [Brachionus plicatilis]|uniref:Acid-sensing ion channel 4 n=1 Tax=Brachionus plicatilis TaxID=10195 RepID=A0A3M7Q419_BRAPC|nr:acid-sensing ion channel 4 [Brachionus plicatilis]
MAYKNLKLTLKEHLSSSTVHGLSKINNSQTTLSRVIWIIGFFVAVGCCSFMLIQNISEYLKYETTTKIETKFELSPVFPTVTVCNVNFFTSDYAIEFFSNRSNISYNPLNKYQQSIDEIYSNPEYLKNIDQFGDRYEKLFIYCNFDIYSCNNASFWRSYQSNLFGNCYQFNTDSKNLLTNSIPGFQNGLQIWLNVSVPKELTHLHFKTGAVIFIHNHTQIPDTGNFLMAPVGYETSISVSRVFTRKIKKPYSDCDGDTDNPDAYDSKIFKSIHSKGLKYTQKFCMIVCLQEFILEKCSCVFSKYSFQHLIENKIQACGPLNMSILCAHAKTNEFLSNSQIYGSCHAKCPLECESSRLEKTHSTIDAMNEEWEKIIKNFTNQIDSADRKIKDELLIINIFYDELEYTLISEGESFKIISLISNLGGIAGLFLGASFLSVLELVELLAELLIFTDLFLWFYQNLREFRYLPSISLIACNWVNSSYFQQYINSTGQMKRINSKINTIIYFENF